ncbi:MAG: DsrE family protein [bacterium]|nr:DsrE family protein [bacterium]
MAKLGFMVTRSLSASAGSRTLQFLAAAALGKQHEVSVFFTADGVYQCMRRKKNPGADDNDLSQKLQSLAQAGAKLVASSSCLEMRGITLNDVCPGVKVVTYEDIARQIGLLEQVVCL